MLVLALFPLAFQGFSPTPGESFLSCSLFGNLPPPLDLCRNCLLSGLSASLSNTQTLSPVGQNLLIRGTNYCPVPCVPLEELLLANYLPSLGTSLKIVWLRQWKSMWPREPLPASKIIKYLLQRQCLQEYFQHSTRLSKKFKRNG